MENAKQKIEQFVSRYFRNKALNDNEDIFSAGVVNSLFAMQLVLFLESEFQIRMNAEDMDMDNFRTINRMAELIERKALASSDARSAK